MIKGLTGVPAFMIRLTIGVLDTRWFEDEPTSEPHPAKQYIDQLDSKTLVDRITASSPMVGLIFLVIDDRMPSAWMDMGYGTADGGAWRELRPEDMMNGTLFGLLSRLG